MEIEKEVPKDERWTSKNNDFKFCRYEVETRPEVGKSSELLLFVLFLKILKCVYLSE